MFILSASEKILVFICGLGILQGLLFAGLIYFHPRSDRSVNKFLALYIFCTSAVISLALVMKLLGWKNCAEVLQIPLLSGPLLYLYLRSFKEAITWRKAWPHFLIVVFSYLATKWNLSVANIDFPDAKEIPGAFLRRPSTLLIVFTKPVQQIIYFYLSRKALLSYQQSILHFFSETSRIDLRWAKFLVYGYLILVLLFVLVFPVILRYPGQFNLLILGNMAIGTFYIYIATYKGVLQPTIWQVQPDLSKKTVEEEIHELDKIGNSTHDLKKQRPGLDNERVNGLSKKITYLMEREKLYQETELTLRQLAGKLEVPVYQVSIAIKEGMGKNFYDLVNGYRVEEAKQLLLDEKNKNYTILSVGFEAGFNSKTTFNTVFKKFTGLTPTEYREKEKDNVFA